MQYRRNVRASRSSSPLLISSAQASWMFSWTGRLDKLPRSALKQKSNFRFEEEAPVYSETRPVLRHLEHVVGPHQPQLNDPAFVPSR